MENNNDTIKNDALDELLFGIADEADKDVDYDAMLETIKKKASARKKRAGFVKYGTMAAAAVIMLAVGGMWIRENELVSYDTATAESMTAVQDEESAQYVESAYDSYDPNADYPSEDTMPVLGYSYSDSDGNEDSTAATAATSSAENEEENIQCFYQDMMLPAIDFGTYYEFMIDDETGLELKIYGSTEEDAKYYLKETAALYGVSADTDAMKLVTDNGITVSFTLDGDTLTVSAQK